MVAGSCRQLQVVTGGYRWLQVVAGGCRWLQVVAGGCRWLGNGGLWSIVNVLGIHAWNLV